MLSDNIIYARFESLEKNKNLPTDVKNTFYAILLENLYDSIRRVVYAEDVMGNFYEEKITRLQELDPFPRQNFGQVITTGGIGIVMELQNGKIMIVDVLKSYPAEKSGGVSNLDLIIAKSKIKNLKFIAMGGITSINIKPYLKHKNVIGIGTSWIAEESLIESSNWKEIRKRASVILES